MKRNETKRTEEVPAGLQCPSVVDGKCQVGRLLTTLHIPWTRKLANGLPQRCVVPLTEVLGLYLT